MEHLYKVFILMFLFSIISILAFSIKKQREKSLKLEIDAQKFFQTVCRKVLTPLPYLPYVSTSEVSRIFKISGTRFVIIKIIPSVPKARQKTVATFEFLGSVIVNNKTNKIYSYSCFENYLTKIARKTTVSGYFVDHL